MIDEKFLVAAVNIRRQYLKILFNLDYYENKAKETLDKLNKAYEKVENLQKEIKELDKKGEDFSSFNKLMEIFTDIEDEGNRLQSFTDPLNKEMEKLALEEQELYKQICEKHSDLSEEQIVQCVKKRLEKENLS